MKKNNRLLPDWKDSGGLQQVSRMMKCVLFFMLTLVCGVEGKVYSQQYILDLHLKQTSLEEVFNRIEAQTGLKFLYNTLLVDSKGKVDVEARQEDIRKVLAELLNPLGLTYVLNSNHVVVKKADAAAPQEKTEITGKVTDSKGSPLPGVTVRIKGTNIGVVSNDDGHYKLTLPAGTDPTLVFSFVGMLSQEAKYTGQKELNIIMHEDVNEMEEVVVTGIFERKEEGFTGSATTLNSEDIRRMTSGNVLKALEMADPGFKMNVSNLAGSNPNVIPDFQMRGQASMGNYEATDVVTMRGDVNSRPNQPLFVLDGVIGVSATTIMDLDPGQVESITLLKDAAATVIYGSEAARTEWLL
ncbi:MAG: carboxypeptidase-like regulatory domain-containing protein [Odoribacter sp.]